jgi:hypothetical protein
VYNGVAIEKYGIPVVVLVNTGFLNDAHSAASGKGVPGVRIVPEPVLCESNIKEDIESGIAAVMDDIVTGLTRPLTADEKNPHKDAENLSHLVFKGSLEEVNRFYYRRGWTDGLPIIPPTEEAVMEMLTGTDLPPDHLVAKVIPRMGKATVEKIAVNAVMAGCLPTYLPVLIAAVQALMDPQSRFDTFEVSTGSWAPFWAVNGPIRRDIHVNCSSGSLSPGDMANAAIGRAVGLIVRNIGGARKAIEDMGVIGNPGKYTLVIGENEEESPWEPWPMQHGFSREDSTVTTFFPNSFTQSIPRETNAQGIVNMLAGMGAAPLSGFIINATWAKILSREGWTRKQVIEYIAANTRSPFAPVQPAVGAAPRPLLNPQDIMLIVGGGPGTFMALLRSAGGFNNSFVTKKIELPRKWPQLVAKYKNLVPVYVRY